MSIHIFVSSFFSIFHTIVGIFHFSANRVRSCIFLRINRQLRAVAFKHRKAAEYVGALVYRFNSTENFANALYGTKFLTAVEDKVKPALCVVKN